MKIRKSKVIISGLLSIFGVSLIGVTAAQWAVSDNADSFTVRVSVDAFKPDEGYYLTFESDDYLTYGSRAVKMGSDAENFAKANNVTIHDGDQVRFYYYDGDTAEDVSSFITCSLGDPHGYASITSNTVTFDTDRHGDTYSFYLKDDSGNKLYMVDEDYSSYDGYYVTKSTDNGSTWCDFDAAWAMTGTSGDNVAEITHAFDAYNSNIKYRIEHFQGDRGIISAPNAQAADYPHFTESEHDDTELEFSNAGTFKLMVSAGDSKIYIQKPGTETLNGYYIMFADNSGNVDPLANTSVKMVPGTGDNVAETSSAINVASGSVVKIALYEAEYDHLNNFNTLGDNTYTFLTNPSIGDTSLTFNNTDTYNFYVNKDSGAIYVGRGDNYTVYLNDGGSSLWGQTRTKKMIYFTNDVGWGSVKAYAFNNTSKTGETGWPGNDATYAGKNDFGQDMYRYELDTSLYDYIIFNNGSGTQTQDIRVDNVPDCTGFYISSWNDGKGVVTDFEQAPERTVNPLIYAWVWETGHMGRWIKLTSSATYTGFEYEMTIRNYETNCIFARCAYVPTSSDGSELQDSTKVWDKTGDLSIPGDEYGFTILTMNSGSWSANPLS